VNHSAVRKNKMKNKIVIKSSERLKELQTKKEPHETYGKELPIIDEVSIYHTSGKNKYKKTLIETREVLSSSNHKFLKIWELYQPTESSQFQYEYGRQGMIIPIKEGKKLIKRLYKHYFEKD
tara:strand:- start:11 stop:376 length:366 start_codon:yes stop_codon:yes gene_type:complete